MNKDDLTIYDYDLDKNISVEEFFEDETPEEIEYYIDLKIHQIIDELHSHTPYQTIKDTILDNEVFITETFYNKLLNSAFNDEEIYHLIYERNSEQNNES